MRRGAWLLALGAGACAGPQTAAPSDIVRISNDVYRKAGLPFSEAVATDGWVHLSGVLGLRPGTVELVPGGIEAESRAVMDAIQATLARLGLGMDRIVSCQVMIDDMAEWPAFNEIYIQYFPFDALPARSAFGADGLALGAAVEVACVARR